MARHGRPAAPGHSASGPDPASRTFSTDRQTTAPWRSGPAGQATHACGVPCGVSLRGQGHGSGRQSPFPFFLIHFLTLYCGIIID